MLNGVSSFFTSESVSEGHPDKLADQISDGALDAILASDPMARVALETFVSTGLVIVGGEFSHADGARFDIDQIARDVIRDVGYDDPLLRFDYRSVGVINLAHEQSADIALGVVNSDPKKWGAGDQGIMFGYACSETTELMPLPITLAHKILIRLAEARKSGEIEYLRPDSKAQVTIAYDGARALYVDTIVLSTQHTEEISLAELTEEMKTKIIDPTIPEDLFDETKIKYHVNPTGRFIIGGPHGDTGLTGRKIIVDTYGGRASHGGGAFSGKDPSKVDRSASYMARYIAKNIVKAGLMDQCMIQLSYAIGRSEPISVMIDSFGSEKVDPTALTRAVREIFDLTPHGIIEKLDLRRPIYKKTAAYGHFGRSGPEFRWEETDMVGALLDALGAVK